MLGSMKNKVSSKKSTTKWVFLLCVLIPSVFGAMYSQMFLFVQPHPPLCAVLQAELHETCIRKQQGPGILCFPIVSGAVCFMK